jgi:hypothetical protein
MTLAPAGHWTRGRFSFIAPLALAQSKANKRIKSVQTKTGRSASRAGETLL